MRAKTDYMKVKTIRAFTAALDDCVALLRTEAENGDLYSGLQADVIEPISAKLKEIVNYGEAPQRPRRVGAKGSVDG